jgi:hypothetical protein
MRRVQHAGPMAERKPLRGSGPALFVSARVASTAKAAPAGGALSVRAVAGGVNDVSGG